MPGPTGFRLEIPPTSPPVIPPTSPVGGRSQSSPSIRPWPEGQAPSFIDHDPSALHNSLDSSWGGHMSIVSISMRHQMNLLAETKHTLRARSNSSGSLSPSASLLRLNEATTPTFAVRRAISDLTTPTAGAPHRAQPEFPVAPVPLSEACPEDATIIVESPTTTLTISTTTTLPLPPTRRESFTKRDSASSVVPPPIVTALNEPPILPPTPSTDTTSSSSTVVKSPQVGSPSTSSSISPSTGRRHLTLKQEGAPFPGWEQPAPSPGSLSQLHQLGNSMHFTDGAVSVGGFAIGAGGLLGKGHGKDVERASSPTGRRHTTVNDDGDSLVVISKLGKGNGGTVFKALHLPTMRVVALKTVHLYHDEGRQQMVQELKVLYDNLADIEFDGNSNLEDSTYGTDEEEEVEHGHDDDVGEQEEEVDDAASVDSAMSGESPFVESAPTVWAVAGSPKSGVTEPESRMSFDSDASGDLPFNEVEVTLPSRVSSLSLGSGLDSAPHSRGASIFGATFRSLDSLSIQDSDEKKPIEVEGDPGEKSTPPPPPPPVMTTNSDSYIPPPPQMIPKVAKEPVYVDRVKSITFSEREERHIFDDGEAPSLSRQSSSRGSPTRKSAKGKSKRNLGRDGMSFEEYEFSKGMAVRGSTLRLSGPDEPSHCPFIVSLYDAFSDSARGIVNLVVEYMDGGSLEDLVQAGGCTDEDVLANIAYNVLQGLVYLHERKKLHRDIKPSNLLINTKGFVKIADFGVSRNIDDGSELAKTFVGTVGYMSPERIQGLKYSAKADIWSLGLSILACALGKFPYEKQLQTASYFELVFAVCERPSPELPESFSADFRDFIEKCLSKDPDLRPTAESLLFHPFIRRGARQKINQASNRLQNSKSVQVKEAELLQICDALETHFDRKKRRRDARIPVLPQKELHRLADNLQLDVDVVSDMMYKRLEGLVLFPDREYSEIVTEKLTQEEEQPSMTRFSAESDDESYESSVDSDFDPVLDGEPVVFAPEDVQEAQVVLKLPPRLALGNNNGNQGGVSLKLPSRLAMNNGGGKEDGAMSKLPIEAKNMEACNDPTRGLW